MFKSRLKEKLIFASMNPLNSRNKIVKNIFFLSLALCTLLAIAVTSVFFLNKNKEAAAPVHKPNKIFTVIVDAGHGGRDEGARKGNIKEKDITLAIAKQVEAFGPQYGLKILLTRHTDTFMNPLHRVAFALQQNADAYVSIHVNELKGYSYVSGMQVYVSNKNPDFNQSRSLGSAVAQNLGADFKVSPRLQQRSENIFVLADNYLPSILIECGFITNPNDLKMLTDSSKIQLIAKQVLTGISAYARHSVINQYAVQIASPSSHHKTGYSEGTRIKKGRKKNSKTV